MIKRLGGLVLNVYSEINEWIDYIFLLSSKDEYERAAEIVQKAYDDWFKLDIVDDSVQCVPIAEYIYEQLREEGIMATLYSIETEVDRE